VRLGVGRATSAIRIAVAVPVATALLVWHEPVQPAQLLGLGLVVLALPLLGQGRADAATGSVLHTLRLLAPLFVVTGLGQLAARIYSGGAPATNTFLYLSCLFAGAAVSALAAVRLQRVPTRRPDLAFGLLLGTTNVAANLCLLSALRALPSAVVFAVSSSAGVVLAAVTGVVVWGERLSRPAVGGVALAAVAVVLLVRS
jgi:drug/metabolite transporter (DMT)-like permease